MLQASTTPPLRRDDVVCRHILERHAAKTPDQICALFADGETWTFAEALGRLAATSDVLRGYGVGRGDRVLIMLPNGADWLRAWWGVTALGAVMVPVHTALRGESLRHVCEHSQASAIVTAPAFAEVLDSIRSTARRIDPGEFNDGSADPSGLPAPVEAADIATINYTSGTTGPPKGVITPHLQTFWGGYPCFGRGAGLRSDDRWLVDTPLFHVAAQQITVAALSVGASIAVRPVFSGTEYWQTARAAETTFGLLAGTMAQFLVQQPRRDTDRGHRMRNMVAAPLMSDPAEFRRRFGIDEIITAYGSTETGAPTVGSSHDDLPPGTCGRPRVGIELRLVDDNDDDVAVGECGELAMRTFVRDELNRGYYNDPAATEKAWRNGWFHTGDVCRRDERGWYFFVDRKRDTLRRRGEMVSSFLVEIESARHPDIVDVACVAAPGDLGEDEVKIFVVLADPGRFDPESITDHLAERLPYFMVPRYIEPIDAIPKTTATARVQKQLLRTRAPGPRCWDREAAGILVGRNGLQRIVLRPEPSQQGAPDT